MQSHSAILPIELSPLIISGMTFTSCMNFMMTSKTFYQWLTDKKIIELLCVQHEIAKQILTAIDDLKSENLHVLKFLHGLATQDSALALQAFKQSKTISLLYPNYCAQRPESHCLFKKPFSEEGHKLYLNQQIMRKKINNHSSLQSVSLFKLPLTAINLAELNKNQFICYPDAVDRQDYNYFRIIR